MLTGRGWWCLVTVFGLLITGVADQRWLLTLVGLTLLLWFLGQWLAFALRAYIALPALRVRRRVVDDRGPVDALWAGRAFHVRLEVERGNWLSLPYMQVADTVPYGVERTKGQS